MSYKVHCIYILKWQKYKTKTVCMEEAQVSKIKIPF